MDAVLVLNADYTLLLGRYPVGPWIGLETTDQVDADGIAAAMATLWDEDGMFAMSSGASISRPPLEHAAPIPQHASRSRAARDW